MNREDILNKARELTCGDREVDYGVPVDNMADIAVMWHAWLSRDHGDEVLIGHDVAIMMVLMKMCRMINSPDKADHYIDAAAYIAIAGECVDAFED